MSILIVGAGATGGYLGAQLVKADRDVRFLVRDGRAAQLARDGLILRAGDATEQVPVATLTASQMPSDPVDIVLIAVKGAAVDSVIVDIAPVVGPGTAVIPVLNGMRHLATLTDAFGEDRVLGGAALLGTQLNQAGEIVVLNPAADLTVGPQTAAATALARASVEALSGAGFSVNYNDQIIEQMWSKWGFIASAGAVCCLLGGTVGEIVDAGGAATAQAIVSEAASTVAAAGHPVGEQVQAAWTATFTAPGSPFAPSLYRDLAQGRPVEVDEILGDLSTEARHHDVPTPLIDAAVVRLRTHNLAVESGQ